MGFVFLGKNRRNLEVFEVARYSFVSYLPTLYEPEGKKIRKILKIFPEVIKSYRKAHRKLHRRSIPVRKFNADTNVSEAAEDLRGSEHHLKYLENVPHKQIEGLLRMIQDKLKGLDPAPPSSYRHTVKLDPEEDLNKLDDKQLKERKAAMDIDFEKNRIKPGDDDFMYNKEVDFQDMGKIESGWDEDDDYSDPEF